MFDSTIVGGGARRILEYTKAHEWAAHNPLTKAGWKIIGMTAFFLLVLYVTGPSSSLICPSRFFFGFFFFLEET